MFLLFLSQKKQGTQPVAFTLHLIALAAFTYFWVHNGGFAGTVPNFLCAYVSFITITSVGVFRWLGLSLLVVGIIIYFYFPGWLGLANYMNPSLIDPRQQCIDYLVIGGLIITFSWYMKTKFLYYRSRVGKRHIQLSKMAEKLHGQNQELATREEETRAINENLESIVETKRNELEKKNFALAEFAFINAHMLRGPLCRVIGLLNLMEKDPKFQPEQIATIRNITDQIDKQVKTINSVLS
jgi:signal transduction histidine kinase